VIVVANQVIAVANHVITVAYSCDRCCQRHLKEIWRPEKARTGNMVASLQFLVSL